MFQNVSKNIIYEIKPKKQHNDKKVKLKKVAAEI